MSPETKSVARGILLSMFLVVAVCFAARASGAGPSKEDYADRDQIRANQKIIKKTRSAAEQFNAAKKDNEVRSERLAKRGWAIEWSTVDLVATSSSVSGSSSKDYKASRAQEIAEMSKEYGLYEHRELLIAHLLRECGSMTEFCGWTEGKESNDNGWAFGIGQWHLWYREQAFVKSQGCWYKNPRVWECDIPKLRNAYFAAHPEMTDWRNQAHRYLGEIRDNLPRYKTVSAVIDSWNAGPTYMTDVRAKLPLSKKLLSLN